jgi:hypothetical protein
MCAPCPPVHLAVTGLSDLASNKLMTDYQELRHAPRCIHAQQGVRREDGGLGTIMMTVGRLESADGQKSDWYLMIVVREATD